MTNPTTHLPVQEPAGAVEAKIDEIRDLVSSLGDYRIMEERGHASAAQVKEAQDEFETALSALASLQPVTQAWRSICDSEWVNIVNAPIVQEQGSDSHAAVCEAFKLIEAKLRELNEFRSAAPQEAVERQPLTEEQVHIGYREVRDAGLVVNFLQGIRYAERHHGIGPATQEEQHG